MKTTKTNNVTTMTPEEFARLTGIAVPAKKQANRKKAKKENPLAAENAARAKAEAQAAHERAVQAAKVSYGVKLFADKLAAHDSLEQIGDPLPKSLQKKVWGSEHCNAATLDLGADADVLIPFKDPSMLEYTHSMNDYNDGLDALTYFGANLSCLVDGAIFVKTTEGKSMTARQMIESVYMPSYNSKAEWVSTNLCEVMARIPGDNSRMTALKFITLVELTELWYTFMHNISKQYDVKFYHTIETDLRTIIYVPVFVIPFMWKEWFGTLDAYLRSRTATLENVVSVADNAESVND